MPFPLPLLLVLAQGPAPSPQPAEPAGIEDNSFLVEEAYNQERGVVQHISTFSRGQTGDWLYTFTQEWPFNPSPQHQLSYTVALTSADGRMGVGDVWVNWRYQVANTERLAIAPRASVSIPSGSASDGRGAGGAGIQVNLPISVRVRGGDVELHSNAGATFYPRVQDAVGDTARTAGVTVAQSAVWRARPRFNVFTEVVFARQQDVVAANTTTWSTSAVVNPGVRWAWNLANGTQIVPGFSVPVDVKQPAGDRWSVFAYLSIEHPFGRHHE